MKVIRTLIELYGNTKITQVITAIKQAFPDLPFSFTPVVREVY